MFNHSFICLINNIVYNFVYNIVDKAICVGAVEDTDKNQACAFYSRCLQSAFPGNLVRHLLERVYHHSGFLIAVSNYCILDK